jgi:hypothetical protein
MSNAFGYCLLVPGSDQRRIVERFCAERGLAHSGVFEDPADLRDSDWFTRPAVRELIAVLKQGDQVAVAGLRSICGNRRDVLTVLRELRKLGVVLHIVALSAKSPSLTVCGDLWNSFLQTLDVLFAFNTRVRGEVIKEALLVKKLEGGRYTNHRHYGWRWEGRRGQQGPVPDEQELAIIAKIIEWRDGGQSWSVIATRLLRSRVVTAAGREWSSSRARRVYVAATRGRGRPAT